jgi:hypothetical protein
MYAFTGADPGYFAWSGPTPGVQLETWVGQNVGKNPDSKNPDSRNPDSKNPDSKNPDIWQVGKNPDKTYFLIKNSSLGNLEKSK